MLAFTASSSRQRTPNLLNRSGLRTTASRQRKWVTHIGRYSTRNMKCVNDFEQIQIQRLPKWVIPTLTFDDVSPIQQGLVQASARAQREAPAYDRSDLQLL